MQNVIPLCPRPANATWTVTYHPGSFFFSFLKFGDDNIDHNATEKRSSLRLSVNAPLLAGGTRSW